MQKTRRNHVIRNENDTHFTPQQLGKLFNLHIRAHRCLDVKCQHERNGLKSAVSCLAQTVYDIYTIYEKQRKDLCRIIATYNDFCSQFAIPDRIAVPAQSSNLEKIAQTIHYNFIRKSKSTQHVNPNESAEKNSPSFKTNYIAENSVDGSIDTASVTCKKTRSPANSVIALDEDEQPQTVKKSSPGNKKRRATSPANGPLCIKQAISTLQSNGFVNIGNTLRASGSMDSVSRYSSLSAVQSEQQHNINNNNAMIKSSLVNQRQTVRLLNGNFVYSGTGKRLAVTAQSAVNTPIHDNIQTAKWPPMKKPLKITNDAAQVHNQPAETTLQQPNGQRQSLYISRNGTSTAKCPEDQKYQSSTDHAPLIPVPKLRKMPECSSNLSIGGTALVSTGTEICIDTLHGSDRQQLRTAQMEVPATNQREVIQLDDDDD